MSTYYQQYLSNHFTHLTNPAAQRRNAATVIGRHHFHLPSNRDAKILEIGPGMGCVMDLLHSRYGYSKISGVDLSPEVVNTCNRILPGSTELAVNTTSFLEQHGNEYDLILMFHVLEHVPQSEILPFLKAIREALREGGRLVIEVPNVANPLTGLYHRYHDFTHTVGFMDQSLSFVLRNAGFSEVSVYECKTPAKSPARFVQRGAQDVVEALMKLALRVYMPSQPIILTSLLGACAQK
jgi:2-polyprenyl-3-methyl-5-hydroxy-6-metoxy-1,4-benzoquinol methylase